jgi:hypothetical protein
VPGLPCCTPLAGLTPGVELRFSLPSSLFLLCDPSRSQVACLAPAINLWIYTLFLALHSLLCLRKAPKVTFGHASLRPLNDRTEGVGPQTHDVGSFPTIKVPDGTPLWRKDLNYDMSVWLALPSRCDTGRTGSL